VGTRRIGWLIGGAENDQASGANRVALQDALARLGWIEGSNLRIDIRFGAQLCFRGATSRLRSTPDGRATVRRLVFPTSGIAGSAT
jgi:hypothetical protein